MHIKLSVFAAGLALAASIFYVIAASGDRTFTMLGFVLLVFPAALGLILLVKGIRRGKAKLSDELLPGLRDKVDDAVQKRRHKKWDKEHGVPDKPERADTQKGGDEGKNDESEAFFKRGNESEGRDEF